MAAVTPHLPGFELRRIAWVANGLTAYDAVSGDSGEHVLVKCWTYDGEPPAPEYDPIWREQHILQRLGASAFAYTLRHQVDAAGSWGIMPWFDGVPLYGRKHSDGGERLRALAVIESAARLLDYLHTAGGVHGALAPDSILWSENTGTARFSDLGFAFLPTLPMLRRARLLEHGKALYSSPEGTGRIGTEMDYRSDLYSLGAILYQLLTGKPPFDYADPLRLAHAHLARHPVPPTEVDDTISPLLSDIVLRLLAKTPEGRYRSGAGLAADLARCRGELEGTGRCDAFALGQSDVPTQLRLSTRLYGRSAEQQRLLDMYEGLKDSGRGLVMVSGYSGVGKTSLVESMRWNTMEDGGFFAAGKFQQSTSAQPFVGVVRAATHLAHQLLTLPEDQLATWRVRLHNELGRNVHVLCKLVPAMELVVRAAAAIMDISIDEARAQFLLTNKRFVRLFARKGSPFVLFLDDVQWMDPASKELLDGLLSDPDLQNFMVITAYRTNEVAPASPLADMLDAPPNVTSASIELEPLAEDSIRQFLVDSFACGQTDADGLAQVLKIKTDGNPFFLHGYVASLADTELIRYAVAEHCWRWDLGGIRQSQVSDNVVEFMQERLKAYAAELQDALNYMACMGGTVPVSRLSGIAGIDAETCSKLLSEAVSDGLVLRSGTPDQDDAYRFTHDRIEQAAYTLLDPAKLPARHATIARRLFDDADAGGRDGFTLAEQLDKAGDEGASAFAAEELASIYLDVGQRAKDSTAYSAARYYLERTAAFAETMPRDARKGLEGTLYHMRAEVEYQLGNLSASRAFVNVAMRHAAQPSEQADLCKLLILQDTLQGHYQEAIDRGRYALSLLGFDLPRMDIPAALDHAVNALAHVDIENESEYARLLDLPETEDPTIIKILDILMYLIPPSYFVHPDLNNLVATEMTRLSFEHGISQSGTKGVSNFGPVIAGRGRFRAGYLFARLALELAEKHGFLKARPRILYTLAGSLNHWVQHLRTTHDIIDNGFAQCQEQGERDYGGYLLTLARCQNEIFLGQPIATFKARVAEIREYVESTQNALGKALAAAAYMALSHLDDSTSEDSPFDIGELSEQALLKSIAVHDHGLAGCYFHVLKAHNYCFLGHFRDASRCIAAAERYRDSLATEMTLPMLTFFAALAALHDVDDSDPAAGDGDRRLAQVRSGCERLQQWSQGCPENFHHGHLILRAGLEAIDGHTLEAVGSYEEAIRAAQDNGYVQFEGLAQSLLADLWRRQGHPGHADVHLAAARVCYERWGAKRLVRTIDALTARVSKAPTALQAAQPGDDVDQANEQLDMGALLELTRRFSSEIGMDALKESLASTMLEVTGAQKFVLLLTEDNAHEPVIAMDVEGNALTDSDTSFPTALVNLVARTCEVAIIQDGTPDASVAHDPYLRSTRPVSALCLPLMRQRTLEGLVYVENRINRMDLSQHRLRFLSVLGAQAAISIRNALLYAELENKVAERTQQLASLANNLQTQVERQVEEIRKLQSLRRFLSPPVADLILNSGKETLLKSHRSKIAILFCDLRGYTAFSEAVEPEEAMDMLKSFHSTVGTIVRHHQATVDHLAGDGMMVFLGDPIASERPIEQAVDMAVEMRTAVGSLIAEWETVSPDLGFGIGLTYGYATIGLIGDDERMEYSATGRHVNLASRLCDEARKGQILVTKRIVAALGNTRSSEFVNTIQLKGFKSPVAVYNVIA